MSTLINFPSTQNLFRSRHNYFSIFVHYDSPRNLFVALYLPCVLCLFPVQVDRLGCPTMSMVAETLTETETDTEGIDDVSSSDEFLEHDGLSAEAGLT